MNRYTPYLEWIATRHTRMCDLVMQWAGINSGSDNPAGLEAMRQALWSHLEALGGAMRAVPLPPLVEISATGETVQHPLGQAIHVSQRPGVHPRALLVIHTDTVYGASHAFQQVRLLGDDMVVGPGVADAKGGIVVMLAALEALERCPMAQRIGWDVLLNPDEEIGSPGSRPMLQHFARQADVGLVFEPALPDGTMIGARKGSGNFTALVRGRSAHAGRDPHLGRSAVAAAADLTLRLDALNNTLPGLTVNVGRIEGGGALNVVPDIAVCRFNARIETREQQAEAEQRINHAVQAVRERDGISIQLTGSFSRPPRPLDAPTLKLYEAAAACGRELGLSLQWQSSGGVSDANNLHDAGLPTIDTMGPRGGDIHSASEFLLVNSLVEKAQLAALLLMKIAAGELEDLPKKEPASQS